MAERKDVTLVAHDVGPSRALERLRQHLQDAGIRVHAALLHGGAAGEVHDSVSHAAFVREALDSSRAVLCGISSAPNHTIELELASRAAHLGIPVFLFADTFGAWSRIQFESVRDTARIMTINTHEASAAGKLFSAGAVYTGNPLWEEDHRPSDRELARQRLRPLPGDVIVAVSWTKTPAINLKLAIDTIDALSIARVASPMFSHLRLRILALKHPGDKTPESMYEPLKKLAPDTESMRVEFAAEDGGTCVEAADMFVHSGQASLARRAVCLNIPVIEITQGRFMQGWLQQEIGQSYTPLAVASGSFECLSSIGMADHAQTILEKILGFDAARTFVSAKLAHAQRVYPPLAEGEAVKRMTDVLASC